MVLIAVLVITACSVNPVVEGQPERSNQTTANTIVPAERPGNDANLPTSVEFSEGKLWLRLFFPQDGDVVDQRVIDVTGEAPAETVISVNGEIFLVSNDEKFSIPVELEEGPNLIEMIASNLDEDQIEWIMTITYEP